MKKTLINTIIIVSSSLLALNSFAKCKNVYTIGDYDAAFANKLSITKLGPLSPKEVPTNLPKSFLEKDGSYAGGEAYCTVKQACMALTQQIANGKLHKTNGWHIYQLDADWDRDTYQNHNNDFRIKHSVKVLKLILKNCEG